MQRENLGPAERIINALLTYTDHLFHGRPGIVRPNTAFATGVQWHPVTTKTVDNVTTVYELLKRGKTTTQQALGTLGADKQTVRNNGAIVGTYRQPGVFVEAAVWFYRQALEVWKLDNEFAARWASHAYSQEHRDLKVVLAALMLVQGRKGDPVFDAGKVAFHDDDYRDVGEAMMLVRHKGKDVDLDPKELLRIRMILTIPEIAQINHAQGFGVSARKPALGRWPRVVEKYLAQRDTNPKLLDAQLKAGYKAHLMQLAQHVGFRPTSEAFFEKLRWKQTQADDGRRAIAIGKKLKAAESWAKLDEAQICERIVQAKYDWKRVQSLLPAKIGVTRAIMAAAIESKLLSDRDLLIYTPTLEELGLLAVPDIRARWEKATAAAKDTRATNIARNVKDAKIREKLTDAADNALKNAVADVMRNMRVYVFIDVSGSMEASIEAAKVTLAKFLQGFPLDRTHVATFNNVGREITIKHASAAGVTNALKGITASGGTDHAAGVRTLSKYKPKDDEDVLFLWIGDEEDGVRTADIRASGLRPTAFGLLKTQPNTGAAGWRAATYGTDKNKAVRGMAEELGIPCFLIQEDTFDDAYAIPRTLRNLIAATPVAASTTVARPVPVRVTLIDTILQTELLQKPAWA